MRVVLDTNVLVAAFLTRGICHELIEHCERTHTLVSSSPILEEFESVLRKKFEAPAPTVEAARGLIESEAVSVVPSRLQNPVSRDPDDDVVLAAAVAGDGDCIITGDKDFLTLEEFNGIPIVSPGEFWRFEAERAL